MVMSTIRKALIPVAGLGTRFLPVTKAVPKELLPILSVPTLQIVMEEALESRIEEVILVVSPKKAKILEYFRDVGPDERLNGLRQLVNQLKISTVLQNEPTGLGAAVLCAREAVGDGPFVVILPDVLIEAKTPCCRQLIAAFEKVGVAVNATMHTPRHKLSRYGVYDIESSDGRFHKARRVLEKPRVEDAPSDFSVDGRYVFPSDVFRVIAQIPPGRNGEIQLADAMDVLARQGRMIAYEYEGRQFDTGDPEGYLKANIYYGRKNYPDQIDTFIRELLKGVQ